MKKLISIAVDDEPNALEIIQIHASKIPFLDLLKTFRDPLEAVAFLQSEKIDLVFLDINMPNLSGLKFREIIGEKTQIIFTTAYSEYAVESYNLNALDYLVKPIQFDRFLKAILKFQNRLSQNFPFEKEPKKSIQSSVNQLFIKSGAKFFKTKTDDILYLEKDGNYMIFHTLEKKILARLNVQEALNLLPENAFLRVHKSFIISIEKIESFEAHQVTIQGKNIPVAKPYRETLLKIVSNTD